MAINQQPPSLQTAAERPISFFLDDSSSGAGSTDALSFYVRPEELTRQDPSRVNVTQTLGGAFADNFGPGVPMITISGHTGWRRDQAGQDGEARFLALRERVFDEWHARRARAVKAGSDPAGVKLIFSDALDKFSVNVAPINFTLRRSRSRPLLLQYQIQMAVLGDSDSSVGGLAGSLGTFGSVDVLRSLGLTSLASSLDKLSGYAKNITTFVDRNIAGPVRAFMNTTQAVLNRVQTAVASVDGASASLLNVAQMATRSGANIFHTLAAVAGIPAKIKGQLMQVATAYMNIYCVLRNALRARILYDDYGDIYGASNCSSTSGGRPLSQLNNVNTFSIAVPAPVPPIVSVSPAATAALTTLSKTDLVLSPLPSAAIGQAVSDIAAGVVLA